MVRKYGKKASDKIGRTMHEFKRGKLKSGGSGKKVTSRKQAIAIGISQAARAGYKVPPPPRGHATVSVDAKVRAYLSNMRPDTEIDGWGMARALKIEPIAASHALERAQKAGLAVTSDGRWFGPRGGSSSVGHARKKTPAQLNREIAEALSDTRRVRSGASAHATRRQVEIDTSVYRRYHGAEPRGASNWTFVIGKREYAHSDDPALYRPAVSRGVYKGGQPSMSFAKAKEHAIAEAKRRGATIIGVGP